MDCLYKKTHHRSDGFHGDSPCEVLEGDRIGRGESYERGREFRLPLSIHQVNDQTLDYVNNEIALVRGAVFVTASVSLLDRGVTRFSGGVSVALNLAQAFEEAVECLVVDSRDWNEDSVAAILDCLDGDWSIVSDQSDYCLGEFLQFGQSSSCGMTADASGAIHCAILIKKNMV